MWQFQFYQVLVHEEILVVTFYFILQTRMFGTFIYLSYFLCQRKYLTLYIILFKRYRNLAIYKVLYGRVIVRAPNHNLGSSRYTNKGLSLMIFKKNFAEYCRSSVHSNKIIYTSTNEKITIFLKSLIIKVALFFTLQRNFGEKRGRMRYVTCATDFLAIDCVDILETMTGLGHVNLFTRSFRRDWKRKNK